MCVGVGGWGDTTARPRGESGRPVVQSAREQDTNWGDRRGDPGYISLGRSGEPYRVRSGVGRTAEAGPEAAALPSGACHPAPASLGGTVSQASILRSFPPHLPSRAPSSRDPAR